MGARVEQVRGSTELPPAAPPVRRYAADATGVVGRKVAGADNAGRTPAEGVWRALDGRGPGRGKQLAGAL